MIFKTDKKVVTLAFLANSTLMAESGPLTEQKVEEIAKKAIESSTWSMVRRSVTISLISIIALICCLVACGEKS
jgi:hypothetical protein